MISNILSIINSAAAFKEMRDPCITVIIYFIAAVMEATLPFVTSVTTLMPLTSSEILFVKFRRRRA